jgi:molecular chaperone HscB
MSESERIIGEHESARNLCWSCREEIDAGPFCSHCVKIQPIESLGNYFTLFDLEESYDIPVEGLKQKFYELSRRFHPDFFSARSAEEQKLACDNTAYLNTALRVLSDPLKRAEYLLSLKTGCYSGHPAPPQELFEEILEAGEFLETEHPTEDQVEHLKTHRDNFMLYKKEMQESLRVLFENLNPKSIPDKKMIESRLDQIRYLRTILARIDQRLEEEEK